MATATKSTKIKAKKSAPVVESTHEETESEIGLVPSKIKKPVELDEPEAVASIDEKIEDDPLIAATEEEEVEEVSLDGEDLNPFGDRWEE